MWLINGASGGFNPQHATRLKSHDTGKYSLRRAPAVCEAGGLSFAGRSEATHWLQYRVMMLMTSQLTNYRPRAERVTHSTRRERRE